MQIFCKDKGTLDAFSLIEIIFTVIIMGIISTIALPRLFETSQKNSFIKLSSDVAMIQNGLKIFTNKNQMNNSNLALNSLSDDEINLFSKILETPIKASNIYPSWSKKNDNSYVYHFDASTNLEFVYSSENLTFLCDENLPLCEKLNG